MANTTGKKFGGRVKGTLNQRSMDFMQTLAANNFDPAKAQIECYREAWKVYEGYAEIYQAIWDKRLSQNEKSPPPEDKADKYLRIAFDAAKDLSGYAYPKLKSIERSPESPLANMSPEQKLEAMKQAVAVLELQIKEKKTE
jgi:hypothetical protein